MLEGPGPGPTPAEKPGWSDNVRPEQNDTLPNRHSLVSDILDPYLGEGNATCQTGWWAY